MLAGLKITSEDIFHAEQILLPPGATFDEERRAYIRDFTTLDLQAVPGSGKTTVILAKLLILERYLPIEDGSGVLVISHTNVAIDEIRAKLKNHCPKLLNYPNFLGTIQSFVDNFLAFPYYGQKYKKKIVRIDNEIYNEAMHRWYNYNSPHYTQQERANARYFLNGFQNLLTYRFQTNGEKVLLTESINGKPLIITKPKRGKNYQDFSDAEKSRVKSWIVQLKKSVMNEGILHYDDAYFLANRYLVTVPHIKIVLQNRFPLVLVDEMQDMDKHQYDLLETIFADPENTNGIYQRIGDKNQAIFNGSAKLEDIWTDRAKVLRLNGSQRLSPQIAEIVRKFGLFQPDGFDIKGRNATGPKPHLIVYSANNITAVPQRFAELLTILQQSGQFPISPQKPIKIVAWNATWKDNEKQDGRVRLIDYFPEFSKAVQKQPIDHDCLKSYLINCDVNERSMAMLQKKILLALLKVMRIEDLKTSNNHRFSKQTMISFIKNKSQSGQPLETFNRIIYEIAHQMMQGEIDKACIALQAYLPEFVAIFNGTIKNSKAFIENIPADEGSKKVTLGLGNMVVHNGLTIELTTVHAVKGQTHSATLYLETSYQGKHESEYLTTQFLGDPFADNKVRNKESTKITYVALSRPETLLCVAISKERYDEHLSAIDKNVWEIIDF